MFLLRTKHYLENYLNKHIKLEKIKKLNKNSSKIKDIIYTWYSNMIMPAEHGIEIYKNKIIEIYNYKSYNIIFTKKRLFLYSEKIGIFIAKYIYNLLYIINKFDSLIKTSRNIYNDKRIIVNNNEYYSIGFEYKKYILCENGYNILIYVNLKDNLLNNDNYDEYDDYDTIDEIKYNYLVYEECLLLNNKMYINPTKEYKYCELVIFNYKLIINLININI